jgi:hypothetical protein
VFWPDEPTIPSKIKEINQRIKEIRQLLEPSTFDVIHAHNIGLTSCKGKLKISGYGIEYHPNEPKDKNHAFIQNYGELKDLKDDQKGGLRLVFSNKPWDFRTVATGKTPDENKTSDTSKIVNIIKDMQALRTQLGQ